MRRNPWPATVLAAAMVCWLVLTFALVGTVPRLLVRHGPIFRVHCGYGVCSTEIVVPGPS